MLAIISSWRSTDLTEIWNLKDLTGIVLLSHNEYEYTKFNKKLFNNIAIDQSRIPYIILELYKNQIEDLKRVDCDLYLCLKYVLNK